MKKLRTRNIAKTIETWEVDESCPEVKLQVTVETTNKVTVKGTKLTGKGPHKTTPVFVKPSFFKLIQERNPWSDYPTWGWEGQTYEHKDIYFGKVQVSRKNLIYPYGSGHILFDADGKPLSAVQHYNYIGSPFTNKWCDLKPMLKHLKNHPWVINGDELVIKQVPYYNNESGKEYYIAGENSDIVSILPDQKSYEEIYAAAIKRREEFFSVEMKELIHSGAPYHWGLKQNEGVEDYLEIRQFHKPHKKLSY